MRLQLTTLDQLVQLMDPKLYMHLQKADSTNFFFFFRMLLVWYKREFSWDDTLGLWERLWTDLYSANFHLFIALSLLEKHRSPILEHLQHFDEVLKYCECLSSVRASSEEANAVVVNELSGNIDLSSILTRAERLFLRFQRTVEALDRKTVYPLPSLRQRQQQAALPHPPEAAESGSGDGKTKPAPKSQQPGGLLGAIAAIGAAQRPPGHPAGQPARSNAQPSVKGKEPAKATTSGTDVASATSVEEEVKPPKMVSPELRDLLSRKVFKLDKKTIQEHGGGIN
jgi:hypothetical protein